MFTGRSARVQPDSTMSPTRPSVLEPISSAELQVVDPERISEVGRRHELLVEYLALRNLQGLLLLRPENFSWLSFGGDNTRRGSSRTTASLFITPEARLVLCNSSDSGQLFDRELAGLGQSRRPPHHACRLVRRLRLLQVGRTALVRQARRWTGTLRRRPRWLALPMGTRLPARRRRQVPLRCHVLPYRLQRR